MQNLIETQAASLNKLYASMNETPMLDLADALDQHGIPNIPAMIASARHKAKRISRLDDLADITDKIGNASLLECSLIIAMLVDRVSDITGCATELEDAEVSLRRYVEAHDEN